MEEVKQEKEVDLQARVAQMKSAVLRDPAYAKHFTAIKNRFADLSKKEMIRQLASLTLQVGVLTETLKEVESEILHVLSQEEQVYDGPTDDHGNPIKVEDENKPDGN